jgi:hypothetical protein
VDQLENLGHGRLGHGWRPLGKAADKLVEELLGGYLELEGIAAVFDEDVEKLHQRVSFLRGLARSTRMEGQHRYVLIPVVDELYAGHRCFSWSDLQLEQAPDDTVQTNVLAFLELMNSAISKARPRSCPPSPDSQSQSKRRSSRARGGTSRRRALLRRLGLARISAFCHAPTIALSVAVVDMASLPLYGPLL